MKSFNGNALFEMPNFEREVNIKEEINKAFREAMMKRGAIGFIKSLFDSREKEAIEREAVEILKRKGLDEKAKRYLEEDANCFFEECINGIRFLDYLPKNIRLDTNNILWYNNEAIAIVNHNIIPIKGKKEKLREALQEIQKIRAEAEEDEAYLKGLKFGKEIAEADRIAFRFGKFFDRIEGKEDFVSRILKNLNSLPEFDPEEEIRERELRENEIKIKILEELPYVKIERQKMFGFLPRQHVTLNPGYEEFFYNHLGEYTRDEIYKALTDLGKELKGYEKEKLKALRKEFERREGISRRKKATPLALSILGGAILGGAFYHLAKPNIHSFTVKKIPEEGKAELLVNASSTLGIDKVIAEINGKSVEMIKLPNGLYAYNVTLDEIPVVLPVKVYVSKFPLTSSASANINWTLQDAFVYYGIKNDLPASKVQKFFGNYNDLIKTYYPTNKTDLLVLLNVYSKNATLLDAAKQKVYSDPNVTDKVRIFLELSKALYDLNEKSLSDTSLNFLGNLTDAEGKNPVAVFNRTALWNVLNLTQQHPIIVTGLSGKQPIVYGEAPILVYIVNDNLRDAGDYPYAAWALAKQAYAIGNKWLGINYTQVFDINGTKYDMRSVVNVDFKTLADYTRKGKMLIGLDQKKLVATVPSDHSNNLEIIDNRMRQLVLPQPLFYIIGNETAYAWEKYPDAFRVYSNGPSHPLFPVYKPGIALKVATDNIKAIEKLRDLSFNYYTDKYGWTAYDILKEQLRIGKSVWPHAVSEGEKDFELLWHYGSPIAKAALQAYAKAWADVFLSDKPWEEIMKFEEKRVGEAVVRLWSLGVPGFIGAICYPDEHAVHGEITFPLTPYDIKLLYSRSPSKLLAEGDKKTLSYYWLASRAESLKEDKTPYAFIFLPSLKNYEYWSLQEGFKEREY